MLRHSALTACWQSPRVTVMKSDVQVSVPEMAVTHSGLASPSCSPSLPHTCAANEQGSNHAPCRPKLLRMTAIWAPNWVHTQQMGCRQATCLNSPGWATSPDLQTNHIPNVTPTIPHISSACSCPHTSGTAANDRQAARPAKVRRHVLSRELPGHAHAACLNQIFSA